MPAIQSYFIEPIFEQFRALLPERKVDHPLGCHKPRIPDHLVFEKLLQILWCSVAPTGGSLTSPARPLHCAADATSGSRPE